MLCFSCDDDDNESTELVCSEEISFYMDGELFNFILDEGSQSGPSAQFFLNQPSPLNGNMLSRTLA